MATRNNLIVARTEGFKAAARKIEAVAREAGDGMVSGIRVIAEEIRTDVSASRPGAGVPKDEGPLAASGKVKGVNKSTVDLTYGGAAEPYALYQHEMLDLHHELGEARYLIRGMERFEQGGGPEDALREMMDAAIKAGKIQS